MGSGIRDRRVRGNNALSVRVTGCQLLVRDTLPVQVIGSQLSADRPVFHVKHRGAGIVARLHFPKQNIIYRYTKKTSAQHHQYIYKSYHIFHFE